MKRNKLKSLLVVALIGTAVFASAQAPTNSAPVVQKHSGRNGAELEKEMLLQLNLSSIQKDQVKAAFKTMKESEKTLKKSEKGTTVSPEDRKTQMKAIHKTYMDSLKTILTPAQLIQLKALRKELRKKAQDDKAAAAATKAP